MKEEYNIEKKIEKQCIVDVYNKTDYITSLWIENRNQIVWDIINTIRGLEGLETI